VKKEEEVIITKEMENELKQKAEGTKRNRILLLNEIFF
jgi:hypothetical protein